eukprot:TRINITY_DN6854_c0_g1_i1.p1 TRINITY_DN6854_c0_g1~~TRINITY_DN6854_c0_g1_i1.p1  ORF type:complete len:412 (-),score=86.98 TRINITY_DN6854_c0_g1_i1:23-1258(-)
MSLHINRKFRVLNDTYVIGNVIGEGSFGTVCSARVIFTQEKVAIKKIFVSKNNSRKLMREIQILEMLDHPNVVQLIEVIDDRDGGDCLYLVVEFVDGGDLHDYISEHGRLSEDDARFVMRQLLSAIEYCHSVLVVHRDLKPENILLDKNLNVKVTDFGLANVSTPGRKLDTFCGSLPYAAPEILNGDTYVGQFADIWSLGIILYSMVTGALPWSASSADELLDTIIDEGLAVPEYVSESCLEVIIGMLELDYRNRSTLKAIREHEWINVGYKEKPASCLKEYGPIDWIDVHILNQLQKIGFPDADSPENQELIMKGEKCQIVATYHLILTEKSNRKRKSSMPPDIPNRSRTLKKKAKIDKRKKKKHSEDVKRKHFSGVDEDTPPGNFTTSLRRRKKRKKLNDLLVDKKKKK